MAKLQWGHGPKTVESNQGLDMESDKIALQWGHGPKTVESWCWVSGQ